MSSHRLTVVIGGREALPVRAIPYVTGWWLSPEQVAMELTQNREECFGELRYLTAYHLVEGQPEKVMPREWDAVAVRFKALMHEIQQQFPDHARGHDAWREQAVSVLPSGVVVWLDEFEKEFLAGDERVQSNGCRKRGLNFAPMCADQVWPVVIAGLEAYASGGESTEEKPSQSSMDTPSAAHVQAEMTETDADDRGTRREKGEPRLRQGSNSREKMEAWVAWHAADLKKEGDTGTMLAERILLLADKHHYESERKPLTIASIVKMLPAGMTGGRKKNGGRREK